MSPLLSYVEHGPWLPILLAAAGSLLARRDTRMWFPGRKLTDWNVERERAGYEAQPDRPVRDIPAHKVRKLFGFWAVRTDWDAERRRLGYGVTVDGEYRVLRGPRGS